MRLSDIMHLRPSFCEKYVGGELTPSPPVFFFEKYSKIVNFLGNFAQILYSTQCKRCCPQTCIFQKEACKRINSPLKDRKIPPKCVFIYSSPLQCDRNQRLLLDGTANSWLYFYVFPFLAHNVINVTSRSCPL